MIGADRVIWRYDPILINEKYTIDYHVRMFAKMAELLYAHTRKVTISFIDEDYRGVKSNLSQLALRQFPPTVQAELSSKLADIARSFRLSIDTCAEGLQLEQFGIEHARCIDDRLLSRLLGCRLDLQKDKSQRLECGCMASIDIGMYNTCRNGCRYCYANYSSETVEERYMKHNPLSPLLSGDIGESDKISERKTKSCRVSQMQVFDVIS